MIDEAAFADLEIGVFGVVRAHIATEGFCDLVIVERADLLFVVLAVEEIGVDPLTSGGEQTPAFDGEIRVADDAGHFLTGTESAEIVDTAEGIGTVEFDVVGIVLDAFHDAVAIGVPTARDPGEFEGFPDMGPHGVEPLTITAERPIKIGVEDLPHLTVGGSVAEAFFAVGQDLAEVHGAGFVLRIAKGGFTEGTGEGGEDVGGAGFVVPDMGTVTEATAEVIIHTFEAVEFAIGRAEGGGGPESGEISHGRFANHGGDGGFVNGFDEEFGLLFELREVLGGVFGSGPGVGKFSGVPVTDDGVFFAFGSAPTTVLGRAIGEVPGKEVLIGGRLARSESALETEGGDWAGLSGFGAQCAIGGEVIPKEKGRVPPAASRPTF